MLKKLFPDYLYRSIMDIEKDFFAEHNIRYVIMDIDNTLVPYTSPLPDKTAHTFLERLKKENIQAAFVSNNSKERVERFNQDLQIVSVWRAKKPLISCIKKAMRAIGAVPEQTALIGDQIFTDIYGGNRAGLLTILVEPIEAKETPFFAVKRKYEKKVLNQMNKERENHV